MNIFFLVKTYGYRVTCYILGNLLSYAVFFKIKLFLQLNDSIVNYYVIPYSGLAIIFVLLLDVFLHVLIDYNSDNWFQVYVLIL